jgi:hypothetical protein
MHGVRPTWVLALLASILSLSACENRSEGEEKSLRTSSGFKQSLQSRKGLFKLSVYSEDRQPIPINVFHNWRIQLRDTGGNPVYPAAFAVRGGMPEHGHGLPTQPKVTRYLGAGEYLLEGVKFNMAGNWRLHFQILSGNLQDTAELEFNVDY